MWRWLFMLTGGFWVAGLWMIWLAGRRVFETPTKKYLTTRGGRLALVMAPVQALLALKVFQVQPESVRTELVSHPLYRYAGLAWLAAVAAVFLVGLGATLQKRPPRRGGYAGVGLAVVAMLAMTIYRDGIRDLTLLSKGFDVWQRTVVTNWSVVGIFLVVFVAGLAGVAWLISVVKRARPIAEKVVS